tara:strand:+ start:658 stop:855 length:198 start_codon:yes stop_codon:yes gene_type:complete
MTIRKLIQELKKIKDKDSQIRIALPYYIDKQIDYENLWLTNKIDIHEKGTDGYEEHGEIDIYTTT